MSITRLQQARQMYAMGQRVRFRGGGMDMGNQSNQDQSAAMGGGNNNNNNKGSDRPETTRHNPHTDSGTSKTSVATGDEMRSAARDFVQTLNTNNAIEAAKTGTKFSPYTGGASFAPTTPQGFNWKGALFNLGLMAINPALAAKYNKAKSLYNTAKFAGKLATDIGLTDKNVVDSFTSNFSNKFNGFGKEKSKGTTSTNNTNNGDKGDGEGLASLENQAGSYNEYILLLQKLQSGNISDAEKDRYNVLKNMLGI
jgi:hypothetical protein